MGTDKIVDKIQQWRDLKSEGVDYLDLPTRDRAESLELLDSFPIRLPKRDYQKFINGFTTEYLVRTRRRDLIKHYLLYRRFREQGLITLLSQKSETEWFLTLMSADHPFLFSQVTGLLASRGMDILVAEAFTHRDSFALDHFTFLDKQKQLRNEDDRKNFQSLLESYLGTDSLPEDLLPAEKEFEPFAEGEVTIDLMDLKDLKQTALSIECPDRHGLLFRISATLSRMGIDINSAFIETSENVAHDLFLVTQQGKPLREKDHAELAAELKGRLTS
ncbi:MAG TPA: ACT domain-containing protein [Acidobacteriota bacterium]|jgi:UTP:GlnB (protein PII) uridylyltransferase